MKVICDGHSKAPTEFLYLETGATPLKDIVALRRIMYLHNILNRDKEELVRRIYETQKQNPTKGDFIEKNNIRGTADKNYTAPPLCTY